MSRLLGADFPAFAAALEAEPVSGLRVNTLKLSADEFRKISPFPLGDPVPWEASAFVLLSSDISPGLHPYHLAGLYYLQDPSAMSAAALLDPQPFDAAQGQPGERVLDLAAAPGGKTTHLAARMHGSGLLVANEIKEKRLGHLAMNVERWGAGNVVVTHETPERLADHFGAFFDRVLVDAPCSGEGMFRKDRGACLDWSPEMVAGCAVRQRNILRVAVQLVRPGGRLLYSTCTFAPEENEAVIAALLDEFPEFEAEALPLFPGFEQGRPEWAGREDREALRAAVRLFPHRLSGEGHFVCRLRRREQAASRPGRRPRPSGRAALAEMNRLQSDLWRDFARDALTADFTADRLRVRAERLYFVPEEMPDFGNLRLVHPGVWLGTFKTGRFEPAHPLALFLRPGGARRTLNLSPAEPALTAYLRGEPLPAPGEAGWTLVTVDGWPLGWGKRVQGLVKNHYPRGWMT